MLPILQIEKLTPLYCKTNGRPTKDLDTLCGLAVLQQHFDLSGIEVCRALSFDLMFQTALKTSHDRTSCISPLTLSVGFPAQADRS
ncbi:MAG: transposase [Deltaproteobacteria bacterium]|nr:transposase [Deltaproteobacteria bacterium]